MREDRILIKQVEIRNFRSIRRGILRLENYNIFVGLNDAGKSNFLKALNLFFNGQTDYKKEFDFSQDFSYLFPKKTHNTKEIKIRITFSLPSSYRNNEAVWEKCWRMSSNSVFKEKMLVDGKDVPRRSKIPAALMQIKFRYIPAVKSKEYYKGLLSDLYLSVSSSIDSPLKNSIDTFSKTLRDYTKEISDNALAHLQLSSELSIPSNLSDIFRALQFITSDSNKKLSIELDRRGDGIQARHIPFILKYIADEDQKSRIKGATRITTIWGFEEPENGMELIKAFDMSKEFLEYSDSIQMFVSTHSPAFYLNKNSEHSKVFYVMKKIKDGDTEYLDDIPKDRITTDMGLMPIVAPLIEKERKEFEKYRQLVEKGIIDVNTIFVEGKYDKAYLEMAIKVLSPDILYRKLTDNELKIYVNDNDGGCNAIVDHVKSWVYSGNKSRVYVIFDRDKEGQKSHSELEKFLNDKGIQKKKKIL